MDPSNAFEVAILFLSLFILFYIIIKGFYDIIMQYKHEGIEKSKNRATGALAICVLGSLSLLVGRIFQIYTKLNPTIFSLDVNGSKKFLGNDPTTLWTNNLSVIFVAMCLLQLAYSWIEVSQNVAKMRNKGGHYLILQRIIVGLEVSLGLSASIL